MVNYKEKKSRYYLNKHVKRGVEKENEKGSN